MSTKLVLIQYLVPDHAHHPSRGHPARKGDIGVDAHMADRQQVLEKQLLLCQPQLYREDALVVLSVLRCYSLAVHPHGLLLVLGQRQVQSGVGCTR